MYYRKSSIRWSMWVAIVFCDTSMGCPASMSDTRSISRKFYSICFIFKFHYTSYCLYYIQIMVVIHHANTSTVISPIFELSKAIGKYVHSFFFSCIAKYSTHKRESDGVKLHRILYDYMKNYEIYQIYKKVTWLFYKFTRLSTCYKYVLNMQYALTSIVKNKYSRNIV